jgi:hypothetical protein
LVPSAAIFSSENLGSDGIRSALFHCWVNNLMGYGGGDGNLGSET